jgi:hypothetical protein
MTNNERSHKLNMLLNQLNQDPIDFELKGNANELIALYHDGGDVSTLRPYLLHRQLEVQQVAAMVASELGDKSFCLLGEAETILASSDAHVKISALEIITVNSVHVPGVYYHVPLALSDALRSVRKLTMLLVSNSDLKQLETAAVYFLRAWPKYSTHLAGIQLLIRSTAELDISVQKILNEGCPLLKKYATIAAFRCYRQDRDLVFASRALMLASKNIDSEISEFATQHLR